MMINENKNDTRKLYKIVSTLTGQDTKNPLPEATPNAKLAKEFADFLLQKINIIRQSLARLRLINQPEGMSHNFTSFQQLMNMT